jgi:hypothetical protein
MEGDMQPNKVVARFKDNTLIKGSTSDFFPNKTQFHLTTLDGKIETIDIERLKALFFVKDTEGNKDHKESYIDDISGAGRKMTVKFTDGEMLIGYSLGYSADRHGFFLTPADLKSNNERIFIIKSATEEVKFV